MKNWLILILALSLIAVSIVLWPKAGVTIRPILEPLADTLTDSTPTTVQPTPTIVIRIIRQVPSVITAVHNLGTLETYAVDITKQVELERSQNILFGISDAEVVRINGKATVIAGIQFDALEKERVQVSVDGRKAVVRLPYATVLHVVPDEQSMQPVVHGRSVFGRYTDALVNKAREMVLADIRRTAIERNICSVASRNAEATIKDLLLKLGFIEIEVTSDDGVCK